MADTFGCLTQREKSTRGAHEVDEVDEVDDEDDEGEDKDEEGDEEEDKEEEDTGDGGGCEDGGRQRSVRRTPGCKDVLVTPKRPKRRASARANSTLAALLSLYASQPLALRRREPGEAASAALSRAPPRPRSPPRGPAR